ncbi:MAG: hypothetical protein HQK91_10420 [Nitrospirae bacterium]|nr:hypothetical protein [Nitrospirota bacterium]
MCNRLRQCRCGDSNDEDEKKGNKIESGHCHEHGSKEDPTLEQKKEWLKEKLEILKEGMTNIEKKIADMDKECTN